MEEPIEAKLFLVSQEDHVEAVATLEKAGTPYCTFPHYAGDYMAIAVPSTPGVKSKKKSAPPPPIPVFGGGQ